MHKKRSGGTLKMTFLGHKNTPYYKIQKKIRFDENFFCIDKNEV